MGNNLRIKLLAPLCLTWILLLGSFLFIFQQAHRSFLDREATSARLQAEQYYRQLLFTETQTLESFLSILTADHRVQDALRSQNRHRLQEQAQISLQSTGKNAAVTHLLFYSPNLKPLAEHHPARPEAEEEYASQVLQQANSTLKSSFGLGLDQFSMLTIWTAVPCYDHNHSMLGFALAGKHINLFAGMTEQRHQTGGKTEQQPPLKFMLLLDKQHLNRDMWEKGMRRTGHQPYWDLLPDSVLANNSLPVKERDAVTDLGIDTLVSRAAVIMLADHYYQATSHTLQDIKNHPVGHLILFTDIDKNIRSIYRSYYTVIGIFILLGGILLALTALFLQKTEQRLNNFKQLLLIESMEREASRDQHHQELQKAWQYLQNIIECIGAPLMVVDEDLQITLTNRSLNELLPGTSSHNPLCRDIFSAANAPPPAIANEQRCQEHCPFPLCPVREVFSSGKPCENIVPLFKKNGLPITNQIMAWPVRNDNGKVNQVVLVFHDITALKNSEDALQRESTVNRSLAELAKAFIEPGISIDKISSLLTEKIKNITGSKLCFTAYIDPQTNHFTYPAMAGGAMKGCQASEENVRSLWQWVLEHRQPLLNNDPGNDPRATGFAGGHLPINNFLAMPAVIQSELIGAIAVANADHPYNDQDQQALDQFAVLFGIAIQRQHWVEALTKSQQEAVAASRSKDQFIANMSHELRTPLNGILGMSNLMLATELTQQQKKYLTMNKASAEALLRIINDILDFSKVAAHKLAIVNSPFALDQLLHEIIETFTTDAHAKGIAISLRIDDNVPLLLNGDANRLRQILNNLTGNATKFTEQGEIIIEVQKHQGCPDDHQGDIDQTFLCFTVRDTGIGIPEEEKAQLFKEFTQLDGSLTRKYGGTGLGLSFCQKVVELMHGKIWCESVAGEGSAFHCLLPFTAVDNDLQRTTPETTISAVATVEPPPSTVATAVSKTPSLRILLAEDDLINREVATEYLRQKNWQITAVTNGHAAVEAFRKNPFDLVLMDVQMPRMDGLEAASKIREIEQHTGGHIPIIALTAHTQPGSRDQCLLAGMDDFLSKPLSPESLYGTIENNLNIRQGNTRHNRREESYSPADGPPEDERGIINLSLMRSALHDNWDLLQKMVNHFKGAAPQQVQTLQEAIANNDSGQTQEVAHSLKGTLANFGAGRAMELAAKLEANATADDLVDAETTRQKLADEVEAVLASLDDALSRRGE